MPYPLGHGGRCPDAVVGATFGDFASAVRLSEMSSVGVECSPTDFGRQDAVSRVGGRKPFVALAGWDAGYWDAALKSSGGLVFAAGGRAAESLRRESCPAEEGVELTSGHLAGFKWWKRVP